MSTEKQTEPHAVTSDDTCPWCDYQFQELYMRFTNTDYRDDLTCPSCEKPIIGTREVVFYLGPKL
jgi:hypothetical protein